MLSSSTELRDKLQENTRYFRKKIAEVGLDVLPGEHPIVPVMFGDAKPAVKMAELLLQKGVYVIPFSFPVVPKEKLALERKSLPHIQKKILISRSRNFRKRKRSWGFGTGAAA